MKEHLSILIVDDHDTISSGLKFELQNTGCKHFINVATAIQEALEFCQLVSYDMAILDISFRTEGNKDGIELAEHIRRYFPKIQIIIYSSYADRIRFLEQLIALEVEAIVSKNDGNKSIIKAIEYLNENKFPYYSPLVEEVINNSRSKQYIHLSKREKEVVLLLQQHLTYKEIAEKLGISKNTVDFHAKNLHSKFNVHKITELMEKVKDYL